MLMENHSAFRLGLIGHPVSHSQSPQLFQRFFNEAGFTRASYELFDLPSIMEFESFLKEQQTNASPLIGFNVTVPHKIEILPFLKSISAEAKAVGAINTVVIERGTEGPLLHGYNTDVLGFAASLKKITSQTNQAIPNAIIMGNGGSAKAVKYVLEQHNIPYAIWHRKQCLTQELTETDLDGCILPHTLFIHTTPVGMWPNTKESIALPWERINQTHQLIDLIYNPEETLMMKQFANKGAMTMNGKHMLEQQALAAWNLFRSNIPQ